MHKVSSEKVPDLKPLLFSPPHSCYFSPAISCLTACREVPISEAHPFATLQGFIIISTHRQHWEYCLVHVFELNSLHCFPETTVAQNPNPSNYVVGFSE